MSLFSSCFYNISGVAFHTAITPVDATGSFQVSIVESPSTFGLVHKTIQDIAEASIQSISVRAVTPAEIDSGLIEGTDAIHPGDQTSADTTLASRGARRLIKPGHFVYKFTISSNDADITAVSKLFQRFSKEGSGHVFPAFRPGGQPSTYPLCILHPEFYEPAPSLARLLGPAGSCPTFTTAGGAGPSTGAAAAKAGGASSSSSTSIALPAPRIMPGMGGSYPFGMIPGHVGSLGMAGPLFPAVATSVIDPSFRGYMIIGDSIRRIEPEVSDGAAASASSSSSSTSGSKRPREHASALSGGAASSSSKADAAGVAAKRAREDELADEELTPMEAAHKRFKDLEEWFRNQHLGDVYGDAVPEHLKLSYEDAHTILSFHERSKIQDLKRAILRPCHSIEQVHERSRVILWLNPQRQPANRLQFQGPLSNAPRLMIHDSTPHAEAMESVASYGAQRIFKDIGKALNHRLDRSSIDEVFVFGVAATNPEEEAEFQTAVNLGLKVIQKARMIRMFAEVLFAQRQATWERRKHLLSLASF
jgi:hypothetical protein